MYTAPIIASGIAVKGYECDSPLFAAHHQPAILLDVGLSRDIDSHALLRGTPLFLEDIIAGQKRISPTELLTMMTNSKKLLNADDRGVRHDVLRW